MSRQSSAKQGLQSTARKEQTTRHGAEPTPATAPVPGAFGRETPERRGRDGGIRSVNPATGETLRTFDALDNEQIDARLGQAAEAFEGYRRIPPRERAQMVGRLGQLLEQRCNELGRLMTIEMGKPIGAAVEEARKCALACRYYAEHGPSFVQDEVVETAATRSFVRYAPLGPILAVMPWNFPFWQVIRFAAPALTAGNVCLLKHASNVPQCALTIEALVKEAGFPEAVFQTLLITSPQVAPVIADPRVRGVTLTGSERAGREVASQAGAAIRKTVLELGGSDPFIVMPSTDLEETVAIAVKARTINNGQSCIAAKRFIVHETIADAFTERFVARMTALRIGDPLDPATELGPLATPEIAAILDDQVARSVAAGARVLTGGARLARLGNYYAPTVLVDVLPDSPAAQEEMFGPVAAIFRARDTDEAIRVANETPFGLGASVWTRDAAERDRFIDEIQSGMVFVNAMVASDPHLPFGGIKNSGYGRELGPWGLREFVNIKTVWITDRSGHHAATTE